MDFRIAVTPPRYDDIGVVLRQMEYKLYDIPLETLGDLKILSTYKVVFVNCTTKDSFVPKYGPAVRDYVTGGGLLYVSDLSSRLLEIGFSELVRFAGGGQAGAVDADIVDPGLQAQFGKHLHLRFDLGGWDAPSSQGKEVRTILKAGNQPLLIAFRYGKGQVIYTSFHNHAQTSDQEKQLLRYLVLKPLMADVSMEMADREDWAGGKDLVESLGTVMVGETGAWHAYKAPGGQPLKVMLNWKGQARLELQVEGPGFAEQQVGDQPPLAVGSSVAAAGEWRYRVRCLSATTKNFPYVLLAGTPAKVEAAAQPIVPGELQRRLAAMSTLPPADPEVLAQIKIDNDLPTSLGDVDIRFLNE